MDNIAIIGMSCLYPDYVTKKDFWQRLINGEDFMSEDNFVGRKIERATIHKDRSKSFFMQYFTREEYDELDEYGELFKWIMYLMREALKDAGYLNKKDILKRTGVVMGAFGMPALEHTYMFEDLAKFSIEAGIRAFLERDEFVFESNGKSKLKPESLLTDTEPQSYVAKKLSLGGPVTTQNAACSTPVYSIKEAIMYLEQGKADMMLAGAQCYNQMDFAISGIFDLLGILSNPGENKPLDRYSQGVIGGSGAGLFVLKKLNDAIRDGDKILGVIESIGWSSDGISKFILAPDARGQIRAYEDAYKDGLSPDIDYIECHATGTAAGDVVEIESINNFFREKGYNPMIGALKGNTGHFFTASSHGAIAKVLMAMEHNMIPQTIRVKDPIDKNIILENTEWKKKGKIKRAAVNSFGFGGTNGHIVIREFNKDYEMARGFGDPNYVEPVYPLKKANMAVVGLGLHIGEMNSVNEYYKYLLQHKSAVNFPTKPRWHEMMKDPEFLKELNMKEMPKGSYICEFEFDFMENKFPATGDEYFLRKDFLLLNVAAEAIKDAGITPASSPNTAVIINCGQDYTELNFMATTELGDRLANSFRKHCPDLTEEQIQIVIEALKSTEAVRQTPTAVPGMMPNIRASRISAKWGFNGPAFAIMEKENGIARSIELAKYLMEKENIETVIVGSIELAGEMEHIYVQNLLGKGEMLNKYGIGEGAVVLVLKNLENAKKDGNRIYSIIDDLVLTTADADKEKVQDAFDEIINDETLGNGKIGYLETPFISSSKMKDDIRNLLESRYSEYVENSDFIESSVEETIGYGFSLTQAVAMVKNSLQVYHGLKFDERNGKTITWNDEGRNRTALINSFKDDGSSSHIALSAYKNDDEKTKKLKTRYVVYPIAVNDKVSLRALLEGVVNISPKMGMKTFYDEMWNKYKAQNKGGKTLCLIAKSKEMLISEANLALRNFDKFFEEGFKWESINGSYFTSNPLGKNAKAVYMWPPGGMFNYVKFFENLSRFPEYRNMYLDFINGDFLTKTGIKGFAVEDYIMELISAQIIAKITKDKMGLKNDMVIGASMGEIAPLFALESITFDEGSTYNSLVGELVDVLDFMFKKKPEDSDYFHKKINSFESWYIKGNREELEKLLEEEKTLFITIKGSPDDTVITGEGEACRRVMKKFKGLGTQIKVATIIHSPIASDFYDESKADEFARKIHFKDDWDYKIYNAHTLKEVDNKADNFQEIFRNIITKTVDFSGSVNAAYNDGGRLFIDMSTNEVCQTWVESNLKGKDHVTLSLFSLKNNTEDHFVRILAKLISNDINFDLNNYLDMFDFEVSNKLKLEKTINMSLQAFVEGLETEENLALRESYRKSLAQSSVEEVKQDALEQKSSSEIIVDVPSMKRFVAKAMVNNVNAYGLYLRNEQVILNNLLRNMDATYGPNEEKDSNNKVDTVVVDNAKDVIVKEEFKKPGTIVKTPEHKMTKEQKERGYLWDLDEIVEMSKGSMAKILGPKYEEVDKYEVRARLPLPPFLFISRILNIEAEFGEIKPSKIEIEYDVKPDCLLKVGEDRVSHVVLTESAQIGIFLSAYMGIDAVYNGKLRFRAVDTKAKILSELPRVGETFRGVYEITTFLKQGATMLLIYKYKCYIKDRQVLDLDGIGGFFTDKDLESKKGIIMPSKIDARSKQMLDRNPIKFRKHKNSYTKEDLAKFYNGQLEDSLYGKLDDHPNAQPIPEEARVLDRITHLSNDGGDFGLGEMIAEKDIDENFWAFKSHFYKDPVYPVSLLLEGVNQMMYFILDANIIGPEHGKTIEPIRDENAGGKFRGQIRPLKSTIKYRISFKNFVEEPTRFTFYYDADIYWQDIHVVRCEDLGMYIETDESFDK